MGITVLRHDLPRALQVYKPECWYYESLEMIRKSMLSGFTLFFTPGTLAQVSCHPDVRPMLCVLLANLPCRSFARNSLDGENINTNSEWIL